MQDKVLCSEATTAMASSCYSVGGLHLIPLHCGTSSTAGSLEVDEIRRGHTGEYGEWLMMAYACS